jgi:hypothetical protein
MLHGKRGAPFGNQNRLRHGRYSAAAVAQRKLIGEALRAARCVLLEAALEQIGRQQMKTARSNSDRAVNQARSLF